MPTHAQLMYQNNISLMKKSINAEKLIAEIEKRQEELSDHNFHSMAEEYDNILGIIASLQQEQPEVDLEKVVEFECIGKKIKMTIQELINYYIDSECCDVADECGF